MCVDEKGVRGGDGPRGHVRAGRPRGTPAARAAGCRKSAGALATGALHPVQRGHGRVPPPVGQRARCCRPCPLRRCSAGAYSAVVAGQRSISARCGPAVAAGCRVPPSLVGHLGPPFETRTGGTLVRGGIPQPVAGRGRPRQAGAQPVTHPRRGRGPGSGPSYSWRPPVTHDHVGDVEITDRPGPRGGKSSMTPDAYRGRPLPRAAGPAVHQTLAGLAFPALHRVHAQRAAELSAGSCGGRQVQARRTLMYSAVNWPGGNTLIQCAGDRLCSRTLVVVPSRSTTWIVTCAVPPQRGRNGPCSEATRGVAGRGFADLAARTGRTRTNRRRIAVHGSTGSWDRWLVEVQRVIGACRRRPRRPGWCVPRPLTGRPGAPRWARDGRWAGRGSPGTVVTEGRTRAVAGVARPRRGGGRGRVAGGRRPCCCQFRRSASRREGPGCTAGPAAALVIPPGSGVGGAMSWRFLCRGGGR